METTVSFKEVVFDGAKEVFESMVFLPLEPSDSTEPTPEEATLLATITFTGTLQGHLSVSCSRLAARAIAAGMLCMESADELADEDVVDAMGEIANLVMGSVKTRVQGEVAALDLSIPSVVEGREIKSRPGEGAVRVAVPVMIGSDHPAEFSLLYRQGNA